MSEAKGIKVKLAGRIDEKSAFPPITSVPKSITLDLQGITLINSTGIKRWVEWMRTLPSVPIIAQNVPPIVIDQCNMVYDFVPKGTQFRSFYVPYYSEETDETEHVLYRHGEEFTYKSDGTVDINHPSVKSSTSGEELEMDVIPEKYFIFLKPKP